MWSKELWEQGGMLRPAATSGLTSLRCSRQPSAWQEELPWRQRPVRWGRNARDPVIAKQDDKASLELQFCGHIEEGAINPFWERGALRETRCLLGAETVDTSGC